MLPELLLAASISSAAETAEEQAAAIVVRAQSLKGPAQPPQGAPPPPLVRHEAQRLLDEMSGAIMSRNEIRLDAFLGVVIDWDPTVSNAYAWDHVVKMKSGLFRTLRTDDELAFFVAHELAHVKLKHERSKLLLFDAGKITLPGLLAECRRMELEADRFAAAYMKRAGYDNERAASGFAQMRANWSYSSQALGHLIEIVKGHRSTHPSDDARIEVAAAPIPHLAPYSEAPAPRVLAAIKKVLGYPPAD